MKRVKSTYQAILLGMLAAAVSVVNISCEPDHSVELIYPDGGASLSITTTSQYGDFPVPAFQVDGGVLGGIAFYIKAGSSDILTKYAVGELYPVGSTRTCVYGGIVSLDGYVVDTVHSARGPLYLAPNRHNIDQVLDLKFEGQGSTIFGLSSGSAGFGLIDTLSFPTVSKITSIPSGAILSRKTSLQIDWSGSAALDQLTLYVADDAHRGVMKTEIQDRGSITIPSSQLLVMNAGPGYIMLVKSRSHRCNLLRRTIATFGETVYRVDVTWK